MNTLIHSVAQASSDYPKALFLMVAGILFVFLVQVVFYACIKIWPKKK
jgi:hypothetical protein